ncbi:hypothetical protein [Phocoenobacter skyensis]|uniref:hypothetical protein n=1 Tax=Phocoenobacter skyensis TaxID=97481 RepID=UPI0027603AB6|nr:hypothetical protein [Pasteurella skyensis]MDP8185354.1 hypothetical protein [Pasteurella skyensis]
MENRIRHLIVLMIFTCTSIATEAKKQYQPKIGDICRVEADYYYAGTWEKYKDDELICNYWKYLGDKDNEERKEIERQLKLSESTTKESKKSEYSDEELEQLFINMIEK